MCDSVHEICKGVLLRMKKGKGIIFGIILLSVVFLGTGPILAQEDFFYDVNPRISYNPIEQFRLGAGITLNNLIGEDQLYFGTENALFTTKDFSSLLTYLYTVDQNDFYFSLMDELRYQGVFDREGYYQRDQFISVGVTRQVMKHNYFYAADLMVKGENMIPSNQPASFEFDQGTDIGIYPSIFGTYQGYTGMLELAVGIPTQYSDYQYVKANGSVKKAFDLTQKDRFVVSTEVGYISGTYPAQKQFFLGSSEKDLFPNFTDKMIGKLSSLNEQSMTLPHVYLDGFQDHAFYGDKMYVAKLEYQRELLSNLEVSELSDGTYILGKVYTVFGDAWTGNVSEGFKNPHTAIGLGLQVEYPSIYPGMHISFNLAQGIGDEAATTFGIEFGSGMQFLLQMEE